MQIHDLEQGSPEWLAYRKAYFNASDAPAMMGVSPYKTRAQLVRELATGITEEVTPEKAALFKAGHRTEELARPLAEKIIGQPLYPLVASEGKLSASFDGLTMDGIEGWEAKMLNNEIRAALDDPEATGADLPLVYQVQMEQQCMVAKPDRILFTATKFSPAGQLMEERHCWYTPNPELAAKIEAGWAQLAVDVAAYQPAEVVPAVVAEPVQALPAVLVQVRGEISITANFNAFEAALRDFLEHRLIREPKTDQDFADLDLQIKAMKGAEAALDAAEGQMLAQIQSVDTAKKTKDMLAKLVRDNRLMAEKLLASEKERRKSEIVRAGADALTEHMGQLRTRFGRPFMDCMPQVHADFPGVIKGKKSLSSMEDAISTELARAKIEANRIADLIQANRTQLTTAEADHLFPDFAQVCTKGADDFANLITSRKQAAAQRLEAERERIRAEEAARLEREAKAAATPPPAPAPVAPPAVAAAPAGSLARRRSDPAAAEKPTLNLRTINDRLGVVLVSEQGLASLGFNATVERGARLYRESDWPAMCRAISARVLQAATTRELEPAL